MDEKRIELIYENNKRNDNKLYHYAKVFRDINEKKLNEFYLGNKRTYGYYVDYEKNKILITYFDDKRLKLLLETLNEWYIKLNITKKKWTNKFYNKKEERRNERKDETNKEKHKKLLIMDNNRDKNILKIYNNDTQIIKNTKQKKIKKKEKKKRYHFERIT